MGEVGYMTELKNLSSVNSFFFFFSSGLLLILFTFLSISSILCCGREQAVFYRSQYSCTVTEYVKHQRPNNSRAWKLKLLSFVRIFCLLVNGFTICMNAHFCLFFKRTIKPFFLKMSILRQRKSLIKPPSPSLITVLDDTLPPCPSPPSGSFWLREHRINCSRLRLRHVTSNFAPTLWPFYKGNKVLRKQQHGNVSILYTIFFTFT